MTHDKSIEVLLDLDGVIIEQAGGYWTKFEVRQLSKATDEIPHGIRYSLTLHSKDGKRVMGFDNAHFVKQKNPVNITDERPMIIIIGIQKMKGWLIILLTPTN